MVGRGRAGRCWAWRSAARRGDALHGAARRGDAWLGKARSCGKVASRVRAHWRRLGVVAKHGVARTGSARCGRAGRGMVGLGRDRQSSAKRGFAGHGRAGRGKALHGAARRGDAWLGKARSCGKVASRVRAHWRRLGVVAWPGNAGRGWARLGAARQGRAWQGKELSMSNGEREIKTVEGELDFDEQMELVRDGWTFGSRTRIHGRTRWTWWRPKQVDSTCKPV